MFLASYILDPAESVDEVAEITKTQGTIRLETDDVFYGKGAKRKVPEESELRDHIARKAKAIFSLKEPMLKSCRSLSNTIC